MLQTSTRTCGIADRRPDAATLRKRQMIYYPIAAILTVDMLGGIYGFINSEETALKTVPPISQSMEATATVTP